MDIVRSDFATGKHCRVSLVRDAAQTLLIWKQPHDGSKTHQMSFRKEIQRSETLRRLGLSDVHVRWHEDQQSLLRTYVPGVTALERFRQEGFWTSSACAPERAALADLIRRAARQCAFITDLNPGNLVFDGTRWHVVDCGSIRLRVTPESALEEYRRILGETWARYTSSTDLAAMRSFLSSLTTDDPSASSTGPRNESPAVYASPQLRAASMLHLIMAAWTSVRQAVRRQ